MPISTTSSSIKLPVAYALPVVGINCLMAPMAVVQGVYAKYFGLSLTTIAGIVLLARIFDVITDPVVGYYADRYYQKQGHRKPFILVGGLLTAVSGYFLYAPPADADAVYFAIWFVVFYGAWTLFEIPHMSWGSDLATNGDAKTKLFTFRAMAIYLGLLLFYLVPQLPLFDTSEITPETLHVSVCIAGCFVLLGLLCCSTISSKEKMQPSTEKSLVKGNDWRKIGKALFHNKPFLLIVIALLLHAIGSGMWAGLIFIYVDSYLGQGESFAKMFMLAFILGIAVAPLWYQLTKWFGKKGIWLLCNGLAVIAILATILLTPERYTFSFLLSLNILFTLGIGGAGIVVPALLSEVADYGEWKFSVGNTATYYSVYSMLGKTCGAVAMALALAMAGWYGFDASANTHSDKSIYGLTLAISWMPSLFIVASTLFVAVLPLTTKNNATIRRRLDQRHNRAAF